ncbi:MAG: lysophospholipid acyltransferase family protein [Pseudomonadota bacterium]
MKQAAAVIRTILFWITIIVNTIIICPAIFVFRSQEKKILQIQKYWARLLLLVSGVQVEVEGIDNIRSGQTYIIMANHQSYHDIFVLLTLPIFIHWMAKKELFKIPVFGWILHWIGAISIDRENKSKASSSIRKTIERIKKGASVLVFPEGTRSPTGDLLPFTEGGFFLAILSRAPILPITINGTHTIMPKGSVRVLPGYVKVFVDPPVETESLTLRDKKFLQEKIQKIFYQNLTSTRNSSLGDASLT